MSAYAPGSGASLALVALALALALLLALWLSRHRARAAAWPLAMAAVVTVERLTAREAPGFRMLAIIGALLLGMKAIISAEHRAAGAAPLSPARWLAFATAWPGMRPALFAGPAQVVEGAAAIAARGLLWLFTGTGLVLLARLAWSGGHTLFATLLVLPGLSLMLHFGLFNLVAAAWRKGGVRASPLFRAPLRSSSLAEFWSRRWNLAFSEMISAAVHRPLRSRVGRPAATMIAFLFSGLLHELAISLPVRAGFGRPSLYFALHGALVLAEEALARAGHPVATHARWGRVWTLGWLVLPLPLLFHRPFLRGVIWPLLE